jgi:hypothetical protein
VLRQSVNRLPVEHWLWRQYSSLPKSISWLVVIVTNKPIECSELVQVWVVEMFMWWHQMLTEKKTCQSIFWDKIQVFFWRVMRQSLTASGSCIGSQIELLYHAIYGYSWLWEPPNEE